ncbi:hypothetical protein ACFVSX_32060 [Streptomyces rubiginosohelvolus]|uniref:hypothetical protein n=1 Tax=Streptomyces rubiginosohelvolus TaxID=67362 RepID=UPI0036DB30B5
MTARRTTPPAAAVAADAHWEAKLAKLRARTRPTVTLTICDDEDLKKAAATARILDQDAQNTAEQNPRDKTAQDAARRTAASLETAQAALDEASVRLRFQALPRTAFRELLAAHPPTEEQVDKGYDHNPDTMAPVLIAAASLDPLTEEDAAQFLADWSQAEGERLYAAALRVQQTDRMDLGKG